MRKIRDVLRLRWVLGLSYRQIGRSLKLGHGTVGDYVMRAEAAGVGWDEVEGMDEEALESKLFPRQLDPGILARPLPDWAEMHRELRRKGMTLALLWQEYREAHPEGYGYSRFCQLYRLYEGRLDMPLRQDHKAGERVFVDYAGQTVDIRDRESGEIDEAQIFVAALGASQLIYAEATGSQTLPDWIGSHRRAFEYYGGVAELVVPDNPKTAVPRPCWYEPGLNRSYEEMAQHYSVAILPARVRKPRDKAKVENAVQQVERWILARLRKQTFFSLGELNAAIRERLEDLNNRPLKILKVSRRDLFEQVEKEALRPLPAQPYEFADWKKVRVGIDYHVEFESHYYSVPYQLIREELDLRSTAKTVEIFRKTRRVAAHCRDSRLGHHTTLKEHMPRSHQAYLEWTPVRLVKWAQESGESTAELVEAILRTRTHPQQGFRSCLGLMRLGERYGQERLEAASKRALRIGSMSYQSVKSILRTGLDQQPLPPEPEPERVVDHDNVRGAGYYAPRSEEAPRC